MLPFRNRLAFGAVFALVFGAIKVALDIAYKVLKILKLQFLLAVLFVGAILFLTKVLPSNTTLLIIFFAFLIISLLYALFGNMNRVRDFFDKIKRKRFNKETAEKLEKEELERKAEAVERQNDLTESTDTYPKYYKVKQNNDYVMAEYKDRYVLYKKNGERLIKIRTDLK